MSWILHDLRFAVRSLGKRPGYSALIVLMLALGVAGNTAIFTFVNGLFLRPLPFPEPDRLVDLDETAPRWNLEFVGVAYPDFHRWRSDARTFEAMAAYDTISVNLAVGDDVSRVSAIRVTHDLATVLGVEPIMGRGFTPEEDRPGGPDVVLVGRGLWERRLGADPDVLGRTLRIDSEPHTVIGVLPSEATFPEEAELWIPLQADPQEHGSYFLNGIGRLKEGVTLDAARADLRRAHAPIWEEHDPEKVVSPRLTPLRERLVGDLRTGANALLAAVGMVLLIACANVASLLLARATTRRREIGIRRALGAGTGHIVRQFLTESLVLATVGGVLGLVLGSISARALVAWIPEDVPTWVSLEPDLRVGLFGLAVIAGTALLFGLVPALRTARSDAPSALQEGARSSPGSGPRRVLRGLVTVEIALAMVLLVAGGLLVRGYQRLHDVDPGFRSEGVLHFALSLPESTYPGPASRRALYDDLMERLEGLPGVEAAGAVTCPPLMGCHTGYFFEAEGAAPRDADAPNPVVLTRWATPRYFDAMGITVTRGRSFTERDGRDETPQVAIVNETFVREFWPAGADPVGRGIRNDDDDPWVTVVGVARDVKHYGLGTPMRPGVYLPFRRNPQANMAVALHTTGEPGQLVAPARRIVHELDSELPLFRIGTMKEALARSLWQQRATSWMFAAFAVVALILAVGGIYGVVSYTVSRRSHEIGVRMALGARYREVIGLVLRQGVAPLGIGLVVGGLGALGAGRMLSSLLFGVRATDPLTYAVVAGILGVVVLAATLVPARRAARIDPVEALRLE